LNLESVDQEESRLFKGSGLAGLAFFSLTDVANLKQRGFVFVLIAFERNRALKSWLKFKTVLIYLL
jgi:hypothetical protein